MHVAARSTIASSSVKRRGSLVRSMLGSRLYEPSELPDDLLDCGAIAYVHKADLDPAVIRRALDASNPQR